MNRRERISAYRSLQEIADTEQMEYINIICDEHDAMTDKLNKEGIKLAAISAENARLRDELERVKAQRDEALTALENTLDILFDENIQPECEYEDGRAYCQHVYEGEPCGLCKARLTLDKLLQEASES